MKRPLVFMFSGQGSHYYQMGRDFYDQHDVFRSVMNEGDSILRPILHRSVIDEIFQNPISKEFNNLLVSHPALVLVEYAVCQALISEGIRPDYVWGSSAGEFAAAIAANVIDFESALLIAAEQAKLTVRFCGKGGIAAVLAAPELYGRSDTLKGCTTFAGTNFSTNFIVSANADGLQKAMDYLCDNAIVFQKLPVSYAFHSAGIDEMRAPFLEVCCRMGKFHSPDIPFLSSAKAGRWTTMEQEYFWQVARGPIQFHQTFQNFPHKDDSVFIDCGPSGTLSTFIKYCLEPKSRSTFLPLLTPYQTAKRHLEAIKEHVYATA